LELPFVRLPSVRSSVRHFIGPSILVNQKLKKTSYSPFFKRKWAGGKMDLLSGWRAGMFGGKDRCLDAANECAEI
jgi:hypothetical protein